MVKTFWRLMTISSFSLGVAVLFSGILTQAQAANWTRTNQQIHNQGSQNPKYAMNAYMNSSASRKIDGYPPIDVYSYNRNDSEQKWDIGLIQDLGNGVRKVIIRKNGYNLCVNAHYRYDGAKINLWPCNESDSDQVWFETEITGGSNPGGSRLSRSIKNFV